MTKSRPHLFVTVPVWRAWLEAWVAGAVGLVLLLLNHTRIEAPVLGQAVFFIISAATIWYALRLRLTAERLLWRLVVRESVTTAAFCLLAVGGWWGIIRLRGWHSVFAEMVYPLGQFLFVGLFSVPILVASRLALYIWSFWFDLRRRHLVWALTHVQLQLVLTFAVILSIIGAFAVLISSGYRLSDLDTWVRTILPFASVAAMAAIFAIIGVLPPAAVIAWLTARRTTRRLQALTRASAALRDGHTSTRVEVDGEDEVAQLQADFNAMAASLDQTLVALQAERDKVAALLDARRQLVAGVSHELRTPLATIRGYLESIQQAPEAEALRHDINVMDRELSRLQSLIDDLFTLSRAELQALALELTDVDLRDLLVRRVDAVAPLAWERDRVQVIAELPDSVPPVRADEMRVEQILVNLLRNALRHTPPGGIIAVSVTSTAAEIGLEVCDTGDGVPQAELPHIWERFYRGVDARARDTHGAGLGLSLVKELAEAMGGRVAVESEPRQGTCFRVYLPRAH